MRTICVVTGSRAEYGLLYWLLKEIKADYALRLQLVVTGMHLSPEFGATYHEIEADGFAIDEKVGIPLDTDAPAGLARAIGCGVTGCGEAFARLKPDIIVVFGDRFEMFAAAVAALSARVPLAHIAGGQLTEGANDDAMRHAITKMAHLHFTATEEYRRRIIQLGEHPGRVFAVGATGLDNIARLKPMPREAFERAIGFKLGKRNLLVTFHPATLDEEPPEDQARRLLAALDALEDTHLIFTMPNADSGGRAIAALIEAYVRERPQKSAAFTSLGRTAYLSALSYVDAVVGNSSSGLIEAPSFRIGTINIGDRQKGRLRAASVIDCAPTTEAILEAIEGVYTPEFQSSLKTVRNPFGDGRASNRIKETLKRLPLEGILKKIFQDIKIPQKVTAGP